MSAFDLKCICLLNFDDSNINLLKSFNQRTFPVKYQKSFYLDVIDKHSDLCIGLTFKNFLIGTICCRIQKNTILPFDGSHAYIMLLGIDIQFRKKGLASQLLQYILDKIDLEYKLVTFLYLHVQINNATALNFYKKHGFIIYRVDRDYYQIEPKEAYVLYKEFPR
eukprot:NODE_444_length_8544_cov_0.465127.p6 type:complete len:165 gc:universal NODE_444_length_8544_cov_0.465127:7351-7845(+)